jgi:uncharacterized protein
MIRSIVNNLLLWKNKPKRKPLILQGARQVGKTYALKQFGALHYSNVIYVNFEKNVTLKNLFIDDYDVKRIVDTIQIEMGDTINEHTTLLIFDEIQEATGGLTSLKYFCEDAPNIHIIAAGSYLGISIQQGVSFPVGKVDFMKMYPLSFHEFLQALGHLNLAKALENYKWDIIKNLHEKLVQYLRLYYFIGGMPEVVKNYIDNKNFNDTRSLQQAILDGYERDFGKYAPADILPKMRLVFQNIISQLAKENKKFIYSKLKPGAKASQYELALHWLSDAGIVFKAALINKPSVPLNAYGDGDGFKLFFVDVGLLAAMGNVDPTILVDKTTIITQFKGALTEQYVAQQLLPQTSLFYWNAERAMASLDFVIQKAQNIIPIEVKAEENLKAKSLKSYMERYSPAKAIKISMSLYSKNQNLENWPLYAAHVLYDAL